MSISLELFQGSSKDFTLTAMGPDGADSTETFTGAEALTAKMWPGGSLPATLTPTATWVSAPAKTWKLSFNDADTAAIAVGIYYIQAWANQSGRNITLLPEGATLEILSVPGTGSARPTYIGIDDVRSVAPWIDDLQVPDNRAGFDVQLADARDWLDECILRNYRGGNVSLLGDHGMALDAWYTGGSRRTSLTNRWMKDNLRDNKLLVTPRIKRICAYYALSLICETLIDKGGKYFSLAARFRFEAESLLSSTTAEIDLNGDGYGEVPINFSSTNTLWA